MKTAVILGINSDIAKALAGRLIADGYQVFGTSRSLCDFSSSDSIDKALPLVSMPWDLLLCAIGTLHPIAKFADTAPEAFEQCVRVNALGPLRMLHHLLPHRRPGAAAVFFSGTNPLKTNPMYSAYSASKALLCRAVEEINAEIEDATFFTLAPGFVRTKIHAGHDVSARTEVSSYADIYECLAHCLKRPKREVGGKKIVVSQWAQAWKAMN